MNIFFWGYITFLEFDVYDMFISCFSFDCSYFTCFVVTCGFIGEGILGGIDLDLERV